MDNTNQSPSSPSPQPPPALRSSSASSLSAQLFGDNDSQHSSAGILASIFPPPSTAAGNGSCQRCSQPIQYEAFDRQVWSTIHGAPPVLLSEDANNGVMKSIFIEKMEPCPLGSSIYYGGQEDMYIPSSASKSYTKDPKDDLQAATRGNWWQGQTNKCLHSKVGGSGDGSNDLEIFVVNILYKIYFFDPSKLIIDSCNRLTDPLWIDPIKNLHI